MQVRTTFGLDPSKGYVGSSFHAGQNYQKAMSDLGEVRAKADMLEGRLIDWRLDTEIRCCGQLAMEYRDRGSSDWDYSSYINEYEEYLKMQEENPDMGEDEGHTAQSGQIDDVAAAFGGLGTDAFLGDD